MSSASPIVQLLRRCISSIPASHHGASSRRTQAFYITSSGSNPALFSTSSISHAKTKAQKKELMRQKTKAYEAVKAQKRAVLEKEKPDPVLGYSTLKPKAYLSWENCELNQLILKNEDVWSGKLDTDRPDDQPPAILNFGLTNEHKEFLFEALPAVSSQKSILEVTNFEEAQHQRQELALAEEAGKRKALARILDLRNANARAIDKVNKQRIMEAFSPRPALEEKQKLDPGCSEVQAAIATYRIHAVLKHAWSNTRDIHSRRHLSDLVMHRMKVLKYLRNTSPERYRNLLPRIGLQPRYLGEELIIRSKLPLQPGELPH